MMARIVAELGRPETPEETAARKAESSRIYRSSQNFRNLIAALLVTMAIVAVVIFAVPRGEPADQPDIDVAAETAATAESLGRPLVAAEVPSDWLVNSARLEGDGVRAWTVVYVPDEDAGFLRVAQGLDADEAWASQVLSGARADDTLRIDGIEWDVYDIADTDRAGNVTYALATAAGADRVLVYGSAAPDIAAVAAAGLTDQILELREGAE